MEKAVLVPQSLQDMSLSSSNGVVLENSLFESFTVLRNIKNIVLTGMIFYVVVTYITRKQSPTMIRMNNNMYSDQSITY